MNGVFSDDPGDGRPPKPTGGSAPERATTGPPQLLCPGCEEPLVHQTVTGGIGWPERRDGFACPTCGGFYTYQDRAPHLRTSSI
jgi:hypothetical protein